MRTLLKMRNENEESEHKMAQNVDDVTQLLHM